jgi:hypothetical protein
MGTGMSLKDHRRRYTAGDIEALTDGAVDRKMAENWHNRGLWLTPSKSPPRGKARKYSFAHLFEASTRAALVEGGFTHARARMAIKLRLEGAASPKELQPGRYDVAEEIYKLPELQQPKAGWYWVITFGYVGHGRKEPEPERTVAIKGDVPVAKTCPRVASVVHISAIVRDVLGYVETSAPH